MAAMSSLATPVGKPSVLYRCKRYEIRLSGDEGTSDELLVAPRDLSRNEVKPAAVLVAGSVILEVEATRAMLARSVLLAQFLFGLSVFC